MVYRLSYTIFTPTVMGEYSQLWREKSFWLGQGAIVHDMCLDALLHWPLPALSDKVREKSGKRSFLKLRFAGEAWKQLKTLF
jgi:hypothetical protein